MAYDGTLKFDTEIDIKGLKKAVKEMDKLLKMEGVNKSIAEIATSMQGVKVAGLALRQTMTGATMCSTQTESAYIGAKLKSQCWRFSKRYGGNIAVFQCRCRRVIRGTITATY